MWTQQLWPVGSPVVVHGPSCSAARGVLVPRPGAKPMSPEFQKDSQPLDHQGSPCSDFFRSGEKKMRVTNRNRPLLPFLCLPV